jgi:hypothetical protein
MKLRTLRASSSWTISRNNGSEFAMSNTDPLTYRNGINQTRD